MVVGFVGVVGVVGVAAESRDDRHHGSKLAPLSIGCDGRSCCYGRRLRG
jgi:hypothetical protein